MTEDDVGTALDELERKLKDLEDELVVAHPPPAAPGAWLPASPPAAAPAPAAPAPAPAAPGLEALDGFRVELERAGSELMTAYERVLGALESATGVARGGAVTPAPVAPPPPTAATPPPLVPPKPFAPASPPPTPAPWWAEPLAPEPAPPAAPFGGSSLDEAVLQGTITVDAGPFTDIATLSSFEQALRGIPGVHDVQVRGFEGSCAFLDVVLDRPVALGGALRRSAPVPFTLTQAGPGRLSIAVEPRL